MEIALRILRPQIKLDIIYIFVKTFPNLKHLNQNKRVLKYFIVCLIRQCLMVSIPLHSHVISQSKKTIFRSISIEVFAIHYVFNPSDVTSSSRVYAVLPTLPASVSETGNAL